MSLLTFLVKSHLLFTVTHHFFPSSLGSATAWSWEPSSPPSASWADPSWPGIVKTKQWLLARELSEFEYSCKTCRFWQVRVLAKMAVFRNMQDSLDSPTLAKGHFREKCDLPRQIHGSNARVLQIWREWPYLTQNSNSELSTFIT